MAFSRAVREFCPDMLIAGWKHHDGYLGSPWAPNISTGDDPSPGILVPSPGQEERWHLNMEKDAIVVRPIVHLDLDRSRWERPDPTKKWAFDPPLLGWGEVTVAYPADGNEEIVRFAGRLSRLVNKVTWKRTGFGLDACRWSQAGQPERRNGLGTGELIDPTEKIALNKYYDDSLWDDRLPDEPTGCRVAYDYPGEGD
ncbi:MAG: hypothetical protein RIC16_15175 [Rhodospirillales bacterium]